MNRLILFKIRRHYDLVSLYVVLVGCCVMWRYSPYTDLLCCGLVIAFWWSVYRIWRLKRG